MKKLIAPFLAAVMCLSLAACGGNTSGDDANNDADASTEVSTEESSAESVSDKEIAETKEYSIGETFGTDSVECIVKEVKWVTPEEFDSVAELTSSVNNGESVYGIKIDSLFPECENSFGYTGGVKSEISDKYFLLVSFSLQNIGKEKIESETEWRDSFSGVIMPYGTFSVLYDDEYTFDCGSESGFTDTLEVLGSAVNVVGGCKLPAQVYENTDKPMKIQVTLPNSIGETKKFNISVR